MIRREKVASKLPQRGVEITDIDYVSGSVTDLDPIADAIRRPHQYVDPPQETSHRCLHRQTHDQREQADGDYGRIPGLEKARDDDGYQDERQGELCNPPEVIARNRTI